MNRIYTINNYLRKIFGEKVVKLSLDGGFTCPNRDGTKGFGGCAFCSSTGSGELSSDIPSQIQLLSDKWSHVNKYLAYFQNHTNTYAPLLRLRNLFFDALSQDKIVGLVVATRPDCLSDEVVSLLSEIQQTHFIWVELGLQTIHDEIANSINRGYLLSEYDQAVKKLNDADLKYVTHLILGLPGENRLQMEESLKYVCNKSPFGLKLHMLNIVKGSQMELTHRDYSYFKSIGHYVNFVCDFIEIIPKDITIHRLNGDAPRNILITPEWSYKKRTILNSINKELINRNSWQGKFFEITD